MQRRTYRGWLALALFAAAVGSVGARVVEPDDNVTPERARELVDQVVPWVEELRGLSFKEPVRVEVVNDAAVSEYVMTRLREFDQEQRLAHVQRAYELLGLLPQGADIVELLIDVMQEQAGGFYDPTSGAYFLLDDMPEAVAPIFTAHELTHALEDQHFDLDKRLRETIDDDDRVLAQSAMHEGTATLLMSIYAAGAVIRGEMSADAFMALAETEAGRAEKLDALPQVLVRQLLGPYVLGALFLSEGNLMNVVAGFPVASANQVMTAGPNSTEQLLHPEKYWDAENRDEPREVTLGKVRKILGKGWTLGAEGVLGELSLAVLVGGEPIRVSDMSGMPDAAAWTHPAAAGWGGDRWELWGRGEESVVVLLTVWDSTEDATEFSEALAGDERMTTLQSETRVAIVAGDSGKKTQRLLARLLR